MVSSPRKPKILMVADQPNWAYDHMARFVMRELRSKYDFYIDYCIYNLKREPSYPKASIKRKIAAQLYRLKYSYKRRLLPENQEYDLVCFLGWYFPYAYDFKVRGRRMVQGIFTDGFPPKGPALALDPNIAMEEFVDRYLGEAASVICGSKLIFERYKGHVKKLNYCTGAIDTKLFKPAVKTRKNERPFVVGWTGDPRRAFKGFYDFVVPAVRKASSLRPDITLKTRFKGPYRTLPKFYLDVDVILIASAADAGPSCFLEAGACGVPAISTRIGFPAETTQDGENGMFVNRSVEEMAEAVVYLYDNPDLALRMAEKIRFDIEKNWDYKARSKFWDQMFQESLSQP